MTKTIPETSKDLGALVDQGKELAGQVRDKAVASVKATHKAVQTHPYKAIGIAFGLGAIAGFLMARRPAKEE